jgi:hypothetical protein
MTTHRWRLPSLICVISLFIAAGCSDHAAERARAQIERIADDLDTRTSATGVYVRIKADELKETDPWNARIKVTYSQGGIAEMIDVRSAGPDRQFHTSDDVATERMAANLKGVGEGIKKNAEETAASVAKGMVKGAVQGMKESIKESLPRRTKDQNEHSDTSRPNGEPTEKNIRP